MITTFRFSDKEQAVRAAAKKLQREISSPKTFVLVSGGSATDILRYVPPPSCPVGLVDERVTNTPADRNAEKIKEIWTGISFVPFEAYEKYAKYRMVITQGIGPDGHTAGIMADAPEDHGKWVLQYRTDKNKFPERITVTDTFLTKAVAASEKLNRGVGCPSSGLSNVRYFIRSPWEIFPAAA